MLIRHDEPLAVALSCQRDNELSQLVLAIEEGGQEEPQIMDEAETQAKESAQTLRMLWERDVQQRQDLLKNQLWSIKFLYHLLSSPLSP